MATEKITITLDKTLAARIRRLVKEGKTPNVSAFVKHAVELQLDDMDVWAAMLAAGLEETGGPLTAEERRWAHGILHARPQGTGSRRRAA